MGSYEKGERTKAELLHAARRLFAEKGYNATTIAEIAHSADVRPGLVHYHFDAKIAIASAIQAEVLSQFIDYVSELLPESDMLMRRAVETLLLWKMIGASDSYARFLYETLPLGVMTRMPEDFWQGYLREVDSASPRSQSELSLLMRCSEGTEAALVAAWWERRDAFEIDQLAFLDSRTFLQLFEVPYGEIDEVLRRAAAAVDAITVNEAGPLSFSVS